MIMTEKMQFTPIGLLATFLGSGFIFGFLYFVGYLYLSFYFLGFPIPFDNLSPFKIAILGITPLISGLLFTILILLGQFIPLRLLKFISRPVYDFLKVVMERKKWEFRLLFFVVAIIAFISFINLYASIMRDGGFYYDTILFPIVNKTPIVKIVYNTPIIDNKFDEHENQGDQSYASFSIESISSSSIKIGKGDVIFTDELGTSRYVGFFVLYFEGNDNYYLLPLGDFFASYEAFEIKGRGTTEAGREEKIDSKIWVPIHFTPDDVYKLII